MFTNSICIGGHIYKLNFDCNGHKPTKTSSTKKEKVAGSSCSQFKSQEPNAREDSETTPSLSPVQI
jgi:hypothetical protein